MANDLGIRGFDYVEFYVGSAKMVAFWYAQALGMNISGYSGPETGRRDKTSYLLTQNELKIVVTSGITPEAYEVQSFVQNHGDGVKRFTLNVNDVEKAFTKAVANGAIWVRKPFEDKDENGVVHEAAIRIYDDTEIVFLNTDKYKGLFRPGFGEPVQKFEINAEPTGLLSIDHIVGNVRENEMNFWADYYNKTLEFETFVDFGPGDISTKYSALLSKVVRSDDSSVKIPINEPYKGLKKSQIQEYVEQYRGTGVQHVAINCESIIDSIRALRKNGVEFLMVPDSYYDLLKEKNIEVEENVDDLRELGILCDPEIDGSGYLLQLFTKPIGDRPTFFFEFIQRKGGSQSFGQGNFQSLFEAIERDQDKRGNL